MYRNTVKNEIESIAKNFISNNQFITKAKQGALSKDHVVRYLKSILYSIQFTPIHLKEAEKRANQLGYPEIAQFMKDKFKEEAGHDQWVKSDLIRMGETPTISEKNDLTEGVVDLVQYLESLMQDQPIKYFAYITFLEYFTVLVAPDLLNYLEENCSVPRKSLTVVSNHGELDKIHVEDDLNAVDSFIKTEEDKNIFMEVCHESATILDRHFNECAEAA